MRSSLVLTLLSLKLYFLSAQETCDLENGKAHWVKQLECYAPKHLSQMIWGYYRSGADTEFTLNDNEAAFQRYTFKRRVLRNVGSIDLQTQILGVRQSSPISIAPSAMQGMASERGELDTARAAAKKGVTMALSTLSTTSMEAVAAEYKDNNPTAGQLWFQLYIYRNRSITEQFLKRAASSGYKAILLTVDTPFLGNRRADAKNKFSLPEGLTLANFEDSFSNMGSSEDGSSLLAYTSTQFDPTLTWDDVEWLKKKTSLKIVLKGILNGEDAKLAVKAGADAIVVSNHGGRQLDGDPATIDALEEVVEAVADKCEVYMDGGVRTGMDVAKALALGAKAVFIGRPVLWGLVYNGASGVEDVISILERELKSTMGLLGATKVNDASKFLQHR